MAARDVGGCQGRRWPPEEPIVPLSSLGRDAHEYALTLVGIVIVILCSLPAVSLGNAIGSVIAALSTPVEALMIISYICLMVGDSSSHKPRENPTAQGNALGPRLGSLDLPANASEVPFTSHASDDSERSW